MQYFTSSSAAVKRAIDASNISDKTAAYEGYLKAVSSKSNSEARIVAQDILGEPVFWDWDCESDVMVPAWFILILGSLRVKCPGLERATTTVPLVLRFDFQSFAFLILPLIFAYRWLSSEPSLSHRTPIWFGWRPRLQTWSKRNPSLAGFEHSIPESENRRNCCSSWRLTALFRWLVYNLSPSFNWGAHGFTGGFTQSRALHHIPDSLF